MSDELAGLLRQLDEALASAESMVAPLSPAQFNWRDTPEHWSVGECLQHLAVTNRIYLPKIQRAIEDGKRRGWFGTGPFRYGWIESYFLRATEPPPKFRVKAPKAFRPSPPKEHPMLDLQTTLAAYRDSNRAIRELLPQANGLDLRRTKAGSPVSDLVKWSLGIILAVVPAHDRRHLWQARQMTARPGFPRS